MKVFITGGTGFIGSKLTEKLVSENHNVVLLLRNPDKAGYLKDERVEFVEGDLQKRDALLNGMAGCDWVFHLAAFTKPWSGDPSLSFQTNVTGTVNVLEAAIKNRVDKVIFTSSAGTMSYSRDGKPVNEMTNPEPVYHTSYEKTKAEAEKVAIEYSRKGLHVVIVNPTRVFGPGRLTKSNSLTKVIKWYNSGFWRIIPGDGSCMGNYAYIEDIIEGHLLAAYSGRSGERYILGGENLSYNELFTLIAEAAEKNRKLFHISESLLIKITSLNSGITKIFGVPPLITREWFDKYMHNWIMSSGKAMEELGYKITPFLTGVSATLKWLNSKC